MRNAIIIAVCFTIFFSFQLMICTDVSAGQAWSKGHKCGLAGLWHTMTSQGRQGLVTFVPLDNSGKRFASMGEGIEQFSEGEYSNSRGIYVRTAPGVYAFTFYSFDLNSDWKIVTSGELSMVDCNTFEVTQNWDFRSEEFNENWCGSSTKTGTRLTVEEELCVPNF